MVSKTWWSRYPPNIQETIAREYWKTYKEVVQKEDELFSKWLNAKQGLGRDQLYRQAIEVARMSLIPLNTWVEICLNLNKTIR